jgi:hypothetical protein
MIRFLMAAVLPQLIGGPLREPMHLLDRNLHRIPAHVQVQHNTISTALSPDGKRFVALSRKKLVIVDLRTRRRVMALHGHYGLYVAWPTRNLILNEGPRGDTVQIHNLRSGSTRKVPIGTFIDRGTAGRAAWYVMGGESGLSSEFEVARFDGGRYEGKTTVRVPNKFQDYYTPPYVRRDFALLTYDNGGGSAAYQLFNLDTGARKRIDLPPGGEYYRWLGDHLLVGRGGVVAKIDAKSATVIGSVKVEPGETVTRIGHGFVVGMGRARYDGHLELVAKNPHAEHASGTVFSAHGRLYQRVTNCDTSTNVITIADPDTGEVLARREERFAIGTVNSPRVSSFPTADCD